MSGSISVVELIPLGSGGSSGNGAATPLRHDEFAALMQSMRPFERPPVVAVAVSGGADSLALTLLAAQWAESAGGKAIGLTVDHGLRQGSGAEARLVGDWLRRHGIAHEILRWIPPDPIKNVQAAAREARYRLLGDWCRANSVLHLLTAHHREDQAETFLLRLGRGSGLFGLACMPKIDEQPHYRLLRPLLGIPAARLKENLRSADQDWIDDPSNQNRQFARVRLRETTALTELGLDHARIAQTAEHLGMARNAEEQEVASLLARAVVVDPSGFVTAKPDVLRLAVPEIRLRALSSILATVSGLEFPPRFQSLQRLDRDIVDDALAHGRTLSGCRIVPVHSSIVVYREKRAIAPPLQLQGMDETLWDGRYLIRVTPQISAKFDELYVGPLQQSGIDALRAIVGPHFASHLPKCVMPTLPGFWQGDRLIHAPYFNWSRNGEQIGIEIRFRPGRPLAGGGFVGY